MGQLEKSDVLKAYELARPEGFEPPTYALRMLKFNLTINKNNYLYCTLILRTV
jgi:hypothetical protein